MTAFSYDDLLGFVRGLDADDLATVDAQRITLVRFQGDMKFRAGQIQTGNRSGLCALGKLLLDSSKNLTTDANQYFQFGSGQFDIDAASAGKSAPKKTGLKRNHE